MRILAGIPTRGRTSAPALAEKLAKFADVMIVASETEIPWSPKYYRINTHAGMAHQRNIIMDYACDEGYDVVVQCDDDLTFGPEVMENFFSQARLLLPLGLASISSKARIYQFWDGPCKSNEDWEVVPRLSALWAIRTDVVKDLGPIKLETLEDVEYALRLVRHGHVPVQISSPGMIYGHSVQRNKTGNKGGQPLAERLAVLDDSIDYINSVYDFAMVTRKDEGSFRCRLDWRKIAALIPDLGLGYHDKRGIRC